MKHRPRPAVAGHLRHQKYGRLLVGPLPQHLIHFRQMAIHFLHHILAPLFLAHCSRDDTHIILHLLNGPRPIDDHHRNPQILIHQNFIPAGVGRRHNQIRPRLSHLLHRKPRQRHRHLDILRFLSDIRNSRIPVRLCSSHQMVRRHHPQQHGIDRCRISQNPVRLPRNLHFLPSSIHHSITLPRGSRTDRLHPAARKKCTTSQEHRDTNTCFDI